MTPKTTANQWTAISQSTSVPEDDATAGTGSDTVDVLNRIMGYDLFETRQVIADRELYLKATNRIEGEGELIAAEDVLGNLDEE